jgi:hypothetical protein
MDFNLGVRIPLPNSAAGGWICTTPAVGGTGTVSCSTLSLATGSAAFTLVVTVDPNASYQPMPHACRNSNAS